MILEETNDLIVEGFTLGPLGTNCYLVWEKDSGKGILIDPGACSDEVAGCIKKNGIEVVGIVNTHGHADHIAGNASFGFPVLIHEGDEPYLGDPGKNLSFLHGSDFSEVKAASLLADGDVITVGRLKFEVIHTPGHTPGGISLKCGNLLFSGDTLFSEGVGRTDLPEGDHRALIRSIKERLFTLGDSVKVFPGHGPMTTIGHEKKNNLFLSDEEPYR